MLTKFDVEFVRAAEVEKGETMDNEKMKILIIEDDPELAMVLSSYLSKYGMEVTSVEDPYIGLSTLVTSIPYLLR